MLAPGAPCRLASLPSLSHSQTHFTGCCCQGAKWAVWEEPGSAQGQPAGHMCPEPVGASSKGPEMTRRAPCPSAAPHMGLRVDAQRQALLQGSPVARVPTGQLPRQPCTRPQKVPRDPGMRFPDSRASQGIHTAPPGLRHPDSPVPITVSSTHPHLCHCSQPSHTCGRPTVTHAHLATRIPRLHTLPTRVIARAHMAAHGPHTCSRGQHADMTTQPSRKHLTQ